MWRKFSAFFCIFLIFLTTVSARKKNPKNSEPEKEPAPAVSGPSVPTVPIEAKGVKISVPNRSEQGYFDFVNPEILSNVEKGSPESLANAISFLKRNQENLTEAEQVIHYIAVSIMQICWKSQNLSETTTGQTFKNDYTGAISSAKNGIYDSSPNSKDFFSLCLPCLVLAASETRSDYYDSAEVSLKKALEIKKDSVFANYLLGILYKRAGNFISSNEYFGYASDLAPNCYECAYSFAESFMAISVPDAAFSLAEKELSVFPQDKKFLKLCAESAFSAGDMANAELYVSRVLQTEPENSYYLLFRARILVKKGEYIRAASLLDAYSKKDSSSRDYLLLRFQIQKNWNKNISAATTTIENALVLYPNDNEVVLEAARLASETGSKIAGKTGEELSDQILESDSDNFDALQIKIASMVSSQKWQEAYKASSALLKKENVPQSALFTHIKICLSANKKEEAWQYASNLYAIDSSNEDILQSYVDVLVSTGRTAEASRLINQLIPASAARMKSFLYYERSFLANGEAAILADLRSSLTANPRNKDSLFRLYRIYYNKKEYRKAQYYLKQVVALSPNDESLKNLNQELENLLRN